MKIGIIRCNSHSETCPAAGCLKAVRDRTGKFAEYGEDLTLLGLDTCGGCSRGTGDRVAKKAEKLAALGAEVVHLGNCLVTPCPYKDVFTTAVEGVGLKVVHGTH